MRGADRGGECDGGDEVRGGDYGGDGAARGSECGCVGGAVHARADEPRHVDLSPHSRFRVVPSKQPLWNRLYRERSLCWKSLVPNNAGGKLHDGGCARVHWLQNLGSVTFHEVAGSVPVR